MTRTTAFVTPTTFSPLHGFAGQRQQSCNVRPSTSIMRNNRSIRMTMADSKVSSEATVNEETAWPPADMTDEWAEAVVRLCNSVNGASLQSADAALGEADGDEMLALQYLTQDNASDIQKQRERAVEKARAAGDVNRVSALKEAELRRAATGSARDFFKGFVEVEGQYVDAGYVDENADAMGNFVKSVKDLFGKK